MADIIIYLKGGSGIDLAGVKHIKPVVDKPEILQAFNENDEPVGDVIEVTNLEEIKLP